MVESQDDWGSLFAFQRLRRAGIFSSRATSTPLTRKFHVTLHFTLFPSLKSGTDHLILITISRATHPGAFTLVLLGKLL